MGKPLEGAGRGSLGTSLTVVRKENHPPGLLKRICSTNIGSNTHAHRYTLDTQQALCPHGPKCT